MAYVSVAEWRPEQVTEWLKGLDNSIISYIHWFSNNEVNGQQLLNLSPDELTHLGVHKLGHQELILEAIQHLRNFHYELDRENLQLLALKLSCAAHSLYSEIKDLAESSSVPTQIMADVANVIYNVKPLVSWLDRPPFSGQLQYTDYKTELLKLSLEMATSAQRDRFAERPVEEIRLCSSKIAKLADSIIQDNKDPMILQPATLDLATIKKKVGEDLDFFLVPSYHGIHQIGNMKLSSPAHQSGKIQQGDEIVQVNYQTVVGWSRKKVLDLFEESPNDLLLTLKRRPRHVKMYGQIYMKPYRLPSRKRASPYSRWNDNLPSPRPELLTIPHFDITRNSNLSKKIETDQNLSLEPCGTSSSSDEEFGQPSDSQSPSSMRLYLPKPRAPIQRRFTLSGPPRPSAQSEQFWRELQLERSWRSSQNNSQMNNSSTQNVGSKDGNVDKMFQLRDKSASLGNSIASASSHSTTCVPFAKDRIGSVKFDLPKFESLKNDQIQNEKFAGGEKDNLLYADNVKAFSNSEKDSCKKESFSESENIITSNSNPCTSLSTTELNKLKRDAFFNNMECPKPQNEMLDNWAKGGSSEKVKRVIQNFKSEINKSKKDTTEIEILQSPGKVMELVESFEKKEIINNVLPKHKSDFSPTEKFPVKLPGGKNRLDKSCSTPAYDTFNEEDSVDLRCNYFDEQKENFEKKAKILPHDFSESELSSQNKIKIQPKKKENVITALKAEKEDNVRNKNNIYIQKENVNTSKEKNQEESDPIFKEKYIQSNEHSSKSYYDSKHCSKLEVKIQKPEIIDKNLAESKSSELQKNDFKSDFSVQNVVIPRLVNLNLNNESNPPIPAQRKSKIPVEQTYSPSPTNCYPLPPKPRTKPLPPSPDDSASSVRSQTPPEPPPRPETTFMKVCNPKKTEPVLDNKKSENFPVETKPFQTETSLHHRKSPLIISSPIITNPPPSFSFDLKPCSPPPISSPVKVKTKNSHHHSTSGNASSEKEKTKSSSSALENLKAMLTLGRKPTNFNSPRSVRKKNAMLAKKRNVSVKEITSYENADFLWHRSRKGSAVASWIKYYFILQGPNFYGFKSKESNKADLFIHLPGFTCTPAEEVKSKDFSFKIYHTGTVFYFAANSKENLQQWLDSVNLAISCQDDKGVSEAVTYSQTDSDNSDTEPEPEVCFPTSPKMKKILGSSPVPKPARSHQNLASEPKKSQEIQRRFGSLKKLTSQKNSGSPNQFTNFNETTEVASLDRKYLRFLGQKNSPAPVPTSRFRSYRRMNPTSLAPANVKTGKEGKSKTKSKTPEGTQPNTREAQRLMRKPLHSSNPSLIHPEMADYRITQERLAEFRRLRNQSGREPDSNRFMSLEQFLQTRQNNNLRSNRPTDFGGFITLEQFLQRQEEERQRSNWFRQERPGTSANFLNCEPARPSQDEERHPLEMQNKFLEYSGQNLPSSSSQNTSIRPTKMESLKPQVASHNKIISSGSSVSGKPLNVIPLSLSGNQDEQPSTSFEMNVHEYGCRPIPESNNNAGDVECVHRTKNMNLVCDGIEYPPAFEPETYTLQYMIRNRQKRDADFKK